MVSICRLKPVKKNDGLNFATAFLETVGENGKCFVTLFLFYHVGGRQQNYDDPPSWRQHTGVKLLRLCTNLDKATRDFKSDFRHLLVTSE